ncbi:hypothetical protein BC830DRAFT_145216 [Chytriomyces sp. MP71]|nr:hypothetical protein BC830DRAFT_145216 [Chytriomyces sp. MP71]
MVKVVLASALAAVAHAASTTVFFADSNCNTVVRATTNGDQGNGRTGCVKDPTGNLNLYVTTLWSSDGYHMMDLALANKATNVQIAQELTYNNVANQNCDQNDQQGYYYTFTIPGQCVSKEQGSNNPGGKNYMWDITTTPGTLRFNQYDNIDCSGPIDGDHLLPDDGSCFNAKDFNGLTAGDSYRQIRIVNAGTPSGSANLGDICFSTADCKASANAIVSCDTGSNLCAVTSCNKGYSLSADGKSCQGPNGLGAACASDINCADGSMITLPGFGSGTSCQSNVCLLTGCSNGYFLSADKKSCLAPVGSSCQNTACYNDAAYLSGLQASGAQCSGSQKCVITACTNGLSLSADQTQCLVNIGQKCTNNCNAEAAYLNSYNALKVQCSGICLISQCAANYTGSSDEESCLANLGATCTTKSPCSTFSLQNYNATSVACTAGTCQLNGCATGFTLDVSSGTPACLANVGTACSSSEQCLRSPTYLSSLNANLTSCAAGVCGVSVCATGFNLVNGTCLAQDGTKCTTSADCDNNAGYLSNLNALAETCVSGTCAITSCATNFGLSGKSCLAYVNGTCATTSNCFNNATYLSTLHAAANTCAAGNCAISSCESDFGLASGSCLVSSSTSWIEKSIF